MAEKNWADEMTEAEWAELEEACRLAEEEEARGEFEEFGGEGGRSLLEDVQRRGRAALAAERGKAG